MAHFRVIQTDVLAGLATLADGSVRCCVTSPPYWGLRDYGAEGQLGLEPTPETYVAKMVEVFRSVRRVLADDGTLWLNLGDSYAAQRGGTSMPAETLAGGVSGKGGDDAFRGRSTETLGGRQDESSPEFRTGHVAHRNASAFGLKHKDLVGIPWRVAFALQADGWYLRSDIIWHKPNPMPESVTDRPTKSHEYLFLLAKSARYFYDAAAISEPGAWCGMQLGIVRGRKVRAESMGRKPSGNEVPGADANSPETRNRRSVWTVATQPFREAHFAVMPEALVEPCILAGSAAGDTVLDPFTGSGTVGVVALRHNRNFVGTELNPEYANMASNRIYADQPLLNIEAEV